MSFVHISIPLEKIIKKAVESYEDNYSLNDKEKPKKQGQSK